MPLFVRLTGFLALLVSASTLFAQPAALPDPKANPMPSVAATVNGQAIHETAVERALQSIPQEERGKARPEVVQYLVDNVIVDQYLNALKVPIDPKEVDQLLESYKDNNPDYPQMLKRMKMTEPEYREQIHNLLRWEKFVGQQATDEKLKALFNHMPEAFDGTSVRARHILIAATADPQARLEAQKKLLEIKAATEKDVAAALDRLPADTDNVTREKRRRSLLDEAFGEMAKRHSVCPTKTDGGDLNWFPRRGGGIVEHFAKAAYALKEFEISDVVATPIGCHLVLVVGRKPGMPVNFEDQRVKDAVKEVYETRLKEVVLDQMRPRTKVEIVPVK